MFNLDDAVARWRRQMVAGGIRARQTLDELESHLRDDFETRVQSGTPEREAFGQAVERIGKPAPLNREFLRACGPKASKRWALKLAAAILLYGLVVVGTSRLLEASLLTVAWMVADAVIFGLFMLWGWSGWHNWFHRRKKAYFDSEFWLTPSARRAVELARLEGVRFNHDFVGTEHLLLGLLGLNEGAVQNLLKRSGIDRETIRTEVENVVGVGALEPTGNTLPATPRLKAALQLAAREAKELNHGGVTPEHILLGLLLEGTGVAALVLKKLGVQVEKMREEIRKELPPLDENHLQ